MPMRWGMVLGLTAGIGLFALLVAGHDGARILDLLDGMGWGLAAVVAVRAAILVLCGRGWAELLSSFEPPSLRVFVTLRWLREAINVLLPVAQIGGDLMGARLLTFWKVPGGMAGASILVDVLLRATAQLLFVLLGVAVLLPRASATAPAAWAEMALPAMGLGLAGFYLAQRHGLFRLVERLLDWVGTRWPQVALGGQLHLDDGLTAIYRCRGAVWRAFCWHFAAWLLGVAEIWIGLLCLGQPPSLIAALVLESLGQAVRSASFPVPGALGVQEGGFVVVGAIFGLGPEAALALSLLKRVPDLVLGLPGLLALNLLESRRPITTP